MIYNPTIAEVAQLVEHIIGNEMRLLSGILALGLRKGPLIYRCGLGVGQVYSY